MHPRSLTASALPAWPVRPNLNSNPPSGTATRCFLSIASSAEAVSLERSLLAREVRVFSRKPRNWSTDLDGFGVFSVSGTNGLRESALCPGWAPLLQHPATAVPRYCYGTAPRNSQVFLGAVPWQAASSIRSVLFDPTRLEGAQIRPDFALSALFVPKWHTGLL